MRGDVEFGTLPRLWASAAERFGDAEALVDAPLRFTFRQLHGAVREAARAFVALGVEPGDRVAIWAPNTWEWVVALGGLHSAGAVLVPLNTRFKGQEAAYILRKSGAKVLLTVTDFLGTDYVELLEPEREHLPALEQVVVLRGNAGRHAHGDGRAWSDFIGRGQRVSEEDLEARIGEVQPDDVSDILFTSGTTGQPKGAMCTHAQALRAYTDWADVVGLRSGDRYLIVNPFFHAFGYKAGIVASLVTGATILPHAVFDPAAVFERIPADGVSMLPAPPALYQTLLHHPDLEKHDMSSLRLAVTGAAVIPVELVRQMRDILGFETVITGYGLTEACGIATMCRHDDDPETIATTSGRAIPGVEVQVVDDDGGPVAHGDAGEIVVRGYNVMLGYYDEPDETQATVDGDGWLHTGDIGVMDDRGYLRITDRKKDVFIVGGFNAYPAEIENAILANEAVAQVAVVGVPDARLGEVGAAFVVAKAGHAVEPDVLIAWCRERMANFKVPRRVELVDALPLNAAGKVLKYELRERMASAASGSS
ncbi:MAG: fatty acid--CoA ligase family protein [Acidimicrobiia bacterium]|nr:fatty acid--CoA ligase family protein [Acidimicrobiia bacterium]